MQSKAPFAIVTWSSLHF